LAFKLSLRSDTGIWLPKHEPPYVIVKAADADYRREKTPLVGGTFGRGNLECGQVGHPPADKRTRPKAAV
jgi:hypothetical protein